MPKNKFQDVVLTAIMATIMVYGMVVYNVALATGGLTAESFLLALYELPIMVPVAFVLEFLPSGKLQGGWRLRSCGRRIDRSSSPMPFLSASAASCAR